LGLSSRIVEEFTPALDSFRSFVDRELRPLAAQTCRPGCDKIPDDVRQYVRFRSAELGFYAADYPSEVGGQDMPLTAKVLLQDYAETSGCALAPVALCNAEGPSALLLSGTPEQRERYLRPLVQAEITRCLALTEVDGGSDAFNLRTRANVAGSGWEISGHKAFVSNADKADIALVYADTELPDGERAPAVFIVSMTSPKVSIGQRYDGLSGEPVFELVLNGVEVGLEHLVGGRAVLGKGVQAGLTSLARGRLLVAGMCNGMAARALALGIEFARDRVSMGTRISQHQHVQEHVVATRVALESARMMTFAAARRFDAGQDTFEYAAMAKLVASEGAVTAVNRMFQVHAGSAWIKGSPLESLYRQVRATTIIEGTSEVQKIIVAHAMGLG
jgi:alkylation response protein AidB-like acyl-CoA dehydrogenase